MTCKRCHPSPIAFYVLHSRWFGSLERIFFGADKKNYSKNKKKKKDHSWKMDPRVRKIIGEAEWFSEMIATLIECELVVLRNINDTNGFDYQ